MTKMKYLCSDSYEFSTRNKNILVVTAGVSVIMLYLNQAESAYVVRECVELLIIVCKDIGTFSIWAYEIVC